MSDLEGYYNQWSNILRTIYYSRIQKRCGRHRQVLSGRGPVGKSSQAMNVDLDHTLTNAT
jgi:hypothetical protein